MVGGENGLTVLILLVSKPRKYKVWRGGLIVSDQEICCHVLADPLRADCWVGDTVGDRTEDVEVEKPP